MGKTVANTLLIPLEEKFPSGKPEIYRLTRQHSRHFFLTHECEGGEHSIDSGVYLSDVLCHDAHTTSAIGQANIARRKQAVPVKLLIFDVHVHRASCGHPEQGAYR